MKLPYRVKELSSFLTVHGLKPMVVGGAVIDLIQGREPKDWDVEVYGSSLDDLHKLLEAGGYKCKVAGKAFGILVVGDMDISIPRKDNKIGKGHKGFEVEFDPHMTPTEGARRRDFTINSMYYDVEKGEIIDPFNGLEDLKRGILRATDPGKFVEDPLRALRAMQLLARKAKTVEPSTINLIRGMVDEFHELPAERVYEEFRKLLMKSEKPSTGLEFLKDSGWIVHFPELQDLIGCEQRPEWHPEGDVWIHTLAVVDAAALLRDKVPEDWQLPYMFAAMLHDIGKPSTTDQELRSFGHAKAGVKLAQTFMLRLKASDKNISRVSLLVGNHMQPLCLNKGNAKEAAWKRLHNKVRLDVLGLLSRADRAGVGNHTLEDENKRADLCQLYFEKFGEKPIAPILMGRHLIASGLIPGPYFGELLNKAYEAQLEDPDLTVTQLLRMVIEG